VQARHEGEAWWEAGPPGNEIPPGVVLMRPGKPVADVSADVFAGVCASLRVAHAAGYVHCDIRLPNLLIFPTGIQLVDYGLSHKIGADVTIQAESGQGRAAGGAVRELLGIGGAHVVKWNQVDDFEMLTFLGRELACLGCVRYRMG
jgi:hypothetical protein